jgi:hypothetical protein
LEVRNELDKLAEVEKTLEGLQMQLEKICLLESQAGG